MSEPVATVPPAFELQARDLHFAYGGRAVLHGVNLTIRPGEVISLLGANGAGKTTLLRLLLGLSRPSAGSVCLNGKPLARYGRRELAHHLAYVPQTHLTPFPYTVQEVAMLGRLPYTGLLRAPSRRDHDVVAETLERLGIAALSGRPYSQVSGGERQLTLIARALAQGARILIMDEPAAGLDYGNQVRFLAHLRALAADGYSVVKATHHPEHALLAASRAALLCDGTIVREGPADAVVTPATIQQLYGVAVTAFHAPEHRATAFYPSERSQPPDAAS